MGRINRKLGTVKSELIIIDPNLISIRLEDGSFIGGEIVEFDDGKYHLAPNQQSINYNPETIDRILKQGWNVRSDYGDIEALADKIAAAGRITNPLHLIFDKNRIFPEDGHRRHYALWLLEQRGIIIKEVLAYVKTLGSGCDIRTLEYEILSHGSDSLELSLVEKGKMIRRHLKEDLRTGLSEEEAKNKFLEETGWKASDYQAVLDICSLPPHIQVAIDQRKIAATPVLSLLKNRNLGQQEVSNIIEQAIAVSEQLGKNKATGEIIENIKDDYLEVKKSYQEFVDPHQLTLDNSSPIEVDFVPVEEPKPKPLVPKANSKEKAEVFDKLMNNASDKQLEDSSIVLTLPVNLWQEMSEIYYRGKAKNTSDF